MKLFYSPQSALRIHKSVFAVDFLFFSLSPFSRFIKKAVDKGTPEYRQLYFFLLKCFVEADSDR